MLMTMDLHLGPAASQKTGREGVVMVTLGDPGAWNELFVAAM
jgi:hypothetical protein